MGIKKYSNNNSGEIIKSLAIEGKEINNLRDKVGSTKENSKSKEYNGNSTDIQVTSPRTVILMMKVYKDIIILPS